MRNYNGTTRTLEKGESGYRSVIFKPSKPPLDSELNFVGDLAASLGRDQLQAIIPSGFLPANNPWSVGYDPTGEQFGINCTDIPNTFIVKNSLGVPFKLNMMGEIVDIGGTGSADASKMVITLPNPPGTGAREDLVMLELWYMQLEPLIAQGKPSTTAIYPFGNVQSGLTPIEDEIYFSAIGTSTTARIQLQYRVRVISGVNFSTHPEGVDDGMTVFAQGSMASPTAYSFASHPTEVGLFIAGDGSSSARNTLGTADGHVYAFPLFRVHRRNAAAFSLLNLNGAGKTIAQGSSDRPDGLFSNKIEPRDLEDMRHFVSKGNLYEPLESNFTALLEGTLSTSLMASPLGADLYYNGRGLHVDGVSTTDQTGVIDVGQPNAQRRVISDADTLQSTSQKINLSDRTFVNSANQWAINDQFVVNVVASNPAGTAFSGTALKLYGIVRSGASESRVEVPVSTVPLGNSTLTCSITSVPSGVTTQELVAEFQILYPAGNGLTFVPEQIHKVYEVRDNANFSFVSKNDLDGIKETSIATTASGHDYIIGSSEYHAFTTLGLIEGSGDGSQSYSIASAWGGTPITHVHWIKVNGVLITRSTSPLAITEIRKNFDNTFTVTFNNAIALGGKIEFGVGLATSAVRFQELNKAIDEMSTIEILSKTVVAGSNGGSGITFVGFNAGSIIFSAQAEKASLSGYSNVCFVDGIQVPCTTTISGSTVIVTLSTPVGVGSNNKVELVVNRGYALATNQRLQVFYDYNPYQGITSLTAFGQGVNSYIKTKIVGRCDGFLIHTSGTNGTNESIPKKFAPIVTKLPKAFASKDSDLKNDPIGAKTYPWHKGIGLNADFTLSQNIALNSFEARQFWATSNADTTNLVIDNTRKMFDSDTIRFSKTGTSVSIAEITRGSLASSDFSDMISSTGVVSNNQQLVFWFFIPDATKVVNAALLLKTASGDHIYRVAGGIVTGWNRGVFKDRTTGTASSTTVTSVNFQVTVTDAATTLRGIGFVIPYLETAESSAALANGDQWYSQSNKTLMRFLISSGMSPISDGFGIHFLKDRAYAFDIAIVSGSNLDPEFGMPHVLGRENIISKYNVNNDRGTYKGSNYYSVGADTIAETKKQAVLYLLEQVIEDPTGHFQRGEYLLKVETKFCDAQNVEVTNSNFSNENAFDVFKIKGRLLGKL
jgi:hypothetical protein